MAELNETPLFAEGEILQAEELNTAIDTGRVRTVRHARQQHRWGIVEGLKLELEKGELKVRAGTAIDFWGREIIIPDDVPIAPERFSQPENETEWFPLFLVYLQEESAGEAPLSTCGGTTGRRRRELHDFRFGRERSATDWDSRQIQESLGPEAGGVLLGFIQWDGQKRDFKDVSLDQEATKVRRFAGLRGNALEAQDASVLVQLASSSTNALSIKVGPSDTDLIARFDRQGNLHIKGKISEENRPLDQGTAQRTFGDVRVGSGVASDGVVLPLPPGVSSDKVESKHVFVRPVASGERIVTECFVDEEGRVRCLARKLGRNEQTQALTLEASTPWSVEYLVVVKLKI